MLGFKGGVLKGLTNTKQIGGLVWRVLRPILLLTRICRQFTPSTDFFKGTLFIQKTLQFFKGIVLGGFETKGQNRLF